MDSFFGIGIPELFLIAIIALVVLGPERLPGAIREVAKVLRTVRNLTTELTSQFSDEMKALDDINPRKLLQELTADLDGEETAKAQPVAMRASSSKVGGIPNTGVAASAKIVSTDSPTAGALSTTEDGALDGSMRVLAERPTPVLTSADATQN